MMKKCFFAIAMSILCSTLSFGQQQKGKKLHKKKSTVLEKLFLKIGGKKIHQIKTLQLHQINRIVTTSKPFTPQGEVYWEKPGKIAIFSNLFLLHSRCYFDGKIGWKKNDKETFLLSEDREKVLSNTISHLKAPLIYPYFSWKILSKKEVTLAKRPLYCLKLKKGDQIQTLYLDKKTLELHRIEIISDGKEKGVAILYLNPIRIQGIRFFQKMQILRNGKKIGEIINKKITVNPKLPADFFANSFYDRVISQLKKGVVKRDTLDMILRLQLKKEILFALPLLVQNYKKLDDRADWSILAILARVKSTALPLLIKDLSRDKKGNSKAQEILLKLQRVSLPFVEREFLKGNLAVVPAILALKERSLPILYKGLGNEKMQNHSLDVLKKFARKNKFLLPAFTKSLTLVKDVWLQRDIINLLDSFGDRALSALPTVGKVMEKCWNMNVKMKMARFIAKFGPRGAVCVSSFNVVVKGMLKKINAGDHVGQYKKALKEILTILSKLGKVAVLPLSTIVESPQKNYELAYDDWRITAAISLGKLGPSAIKGVPSLIKATKVKNPNLQYWALHALWKISGPSKKVLATLIRALSNYDKIYSGPYRQDGERVNQLAKRILIKMGDPAIPLLVKALGQRNFPEKLLVMDILSHYGPKAYRAVPALIQILKQSRSLKRKKASLVLLGKIGPKAVKATAVLCDLLRNWDLNSLAYQVLKNMGPAILPQLVDFYYNFRTSLRYWSRENTALNRDLTRLIQAGGAKAIPHLKKIFPKSQVDLKKDVIGLLKKYLKTQPSLVPFMGKILTTDRSKHVRKESAIALRNLGKQVEKALVYLEQGMEDSSYIVREEVVKTLGLMGAKALAYLKKALEDDNISETAFELICSIKPISPPVLKIIKNCFKSKKGLLRLKAARFAISFKGKKESFYPLLIKLVDDKYYDVRIAVLKALSSIKSKTGLVAPLLAKKLGDKEEKVVLVALVELGKMGPGATKYLLLIKKKFASKSQPLRVMALDTFLSIRGTHLTKELEGALASKELKIKICGLDHLGMIRPLDKKVFALFAGLLRDREPSVVLKTLSILAKKGKKAIGPLRKPLEKLLHHKEFDVKNKTLAILSSLGSSALPAFKAALKDKTIRDQALGRLVKMSPFDTKVLAILQMAFKTSGPDFQFNIVRTLGEQGPKAEMGLPLLIKATYSKNYNVREKAFSSLSKIGKKAEHFLIKTLKQKDKRRRSFASNALSEMGPLSAKYLPDLETAFKDKDSDVSYRALKCLAKMAPQVKGVMAFFLTRVGHGYDSIVHRALVKFGKKITPVLIEKLKSKNEDVVLGAIEVLGELKKDGSLALSLLLNLCTHGQKAKIRSAAVEAVEKINNRSKKVIQTLLKATHDFSWHVRRNSVDALGTLASPTKEVVRRLVELFKTDDYLFGNIAYVRESAFKVICQWATKRKMEPLVLTVIKGALKDPNGRIKKLAQKYAPKIKK